MTRSDVREEAGIRRPAAESGDPRRWRALAVIAAAQLLVVLDSNVVNIALPSAQAALEMSDAGRQWIVTAYTLTFGGFLLLGGRIADLLGRRRVFLFALIGFALASAVGGFAQGPWMLPVARAAQGVFGACLTPAGLALLATMFTEARERAKAFGIFGAAVGSGMTVGMVLGGVLTEYGSWRWCLWVNLPLALLILIPAARLLTESKAAGPARYDFPGALTATLGVGSLIYGISQAESEGWLGATTLGFAVAGLVLLGMFIRIEHGAAHPMMPLRIFKNRVRAGGYLVSFLAGAALYAFYLFLTYYLQVVQGYSALLTGVAFVPSGIGVLAGALGAGRLLARVDARTVTIAGLVLGALGMAYIGTIEPGTGFWTVLFPVQLVVGVGIGAALTTVMKATLDDVSPNETGVAGALTNAMQQIGGTVGVSVLNVVAISVTAAAATPTGETALTDGYVAAFLSGGALLAIAALIAVLVIRPTRPGPA